MINGAGILTEGAQFANLQIRKFANEMRQWGSARTPQRRRIGPAS